MTNSYAIIRAIAKIEGMTPAERWAGAMIAVHLDTKRNQIRVRQSLIAEESGLKERCVRGAVAKMVVAGIFRKVRTQKGLVLVPTLVDQGTPVKESVIYPPARSCRSERRSPLGIRPRTEQQAGRGIQAAGSTVHAGVTTYCPTSCPYLGKNGCKVACGNEEIECPVMAGVLKAEEAKDAKTDG